MQSHRGLPKNLPQRRNKAKIFSPGVSPSKSIQSPAKSSNESPSITPGRQSSPSQSRHRLKSKQKPAMGPPSEGRSRTKQAVNTKQFNYGQDESKTTQQKPATQFLQQVLGMMDNLTKSSKQQTNFQQAPQQKPTKTPTNLVIGPVLQQNPQPLTKPKDEQLISRCTSMLGDQNSWSNFTGETKGDLRTGYGIQYFKNRDKFMGWFKDGKAHGHGTYYFIDTGKRLMAVWLDGEINRQKGYILQKL